MTCYKPKLAKWYYSNKINEKTGEIYKTKTLKFLSWNEITPETPFGDNITAIPCGKCEGCQVDKANDWSTRAILEASQYENNCFITLTYNNEHLPKNRSLEKKEIQKFLKRLRKKYQNIRYIFSGEYGPRTLRPHYHAILFNMWPSDCKPIKKNHQEDFLYTSDEIQKIWGKGFIIIGKANYETAAYVARYVQKKAFGINKDFHLKKGREPEFMLTSRRPATGLIAIKNPKIWEKIRRNDGIILNTKTGVKIKKIPQYLKGKWRELLDREEYYNWADARARELKNETRARDTSDNYFQRLKKDIEIKKAKLKKLDKRQDL